MSKRLPSPALAISVMALFVSLGGTAVAAGVVPLAKRALTADRAKVSDVSKRLAPGSTSTLLKTAAAMPGPANSVAGLLSVKTVPWTLAPGGTQDFAVTCDGKVVSGGWEDPGGWAHAWDTRPTMDGSGWRTVISVADAAPAQQTGVVYAICAK
jgi:hypothetical protein